MAAILNNGRHIFFFLDKMTVFNIPTKLFEHLTSIGNKEKMLLVTHIFTHHYYCTLNGGHFEKWPPDCVLFYMTK